MKCAHPMCNRGIGLVSHRRGWTGKRLYCSTACRDNYAGEQRQPRPSRSSVPSVFELLFAAAGVPRAAVPVRAAGLRARAP
jgi:hypothetical protein